MAVRSVRRVLPQLRRELGAQAEAHAEQQGKIAGAVVKRLLMQTLKHSLTGGTHSLADATVEVEVATRMTNRGPLAEISLIVLDAQKRPHRVWHILEGGTAGRIQRRTTPPIRERKSRRTFVDRLAVDQFMGYTGRVFVIPKGAYVSGIPARRWYEIAADVGEDKIRRDRRLRGWGVRGWRVRRPKV